MFFEGWGCLKNSMKQKFWIQEKNRKNLQKKQQAVFEIVHTKCL